MSAHISIRGVEIGWGDKVLMSGVDLDIARGSVFAILGGSGSGKSSLLRHLIGLERPRHGTITIEGVGDPLAHRGVPPFGVMFQSGALYGSMDLLHNCLLPLEAWTALSPAAMHAQALAKLGLVGLGDAAFKLPGEISGGMKKRAGIARALVLEPTLLFLDEPSAGLDPISAVELDDLMKSLAKDLGMTVVIVTHELPSIFRVVEQCVVLDAARKAIVASGDPRHLRDTATDPFVANFFNRRPAAATATAAAESTP